MPILSHIAQESRPRVVYILLPPSTHRGAFSGQNRDGAPTSNADNTSNAVIEPSDAISQTWGRNIGAHRGAEEAP